ncbi:hypothetical protein EV426DRAFT_706110 [Tirmania nivea]|nr:hypothetical protein EV426DRAFT_706110 [Tirmania nivea]
MPDTCWDEDSMASESDSWAGDSTDDEKSDSDEDEEEEQNVGLTDKAEKMLYSKLEEISIAISGLRSQIVTEEKGIGKPVSNLIRTSTGIAHAIPEALKTWRWGTLESIQRVDEGTGGVSNIKGEGLRVPMVEIYHMELDPPVVEFSNLLIAGVDSVAVPEDLKPIQEDKATTNHQKLTGSSKTTKKTLSLIVWLINGSLPLALSPAKKSGKEWLAGLEVSIVGNGANANQLTKDSGQQEPNYKDCAGANMHGEGNEEQGVIVDEDSSGDRGESHEMRQINGNAGESTVLGGFLEDMYPLVMELIHRNWRNRGLDPEKAEASMREHLECENGGWVTMTEGGGKNIDKREELLPFIDPASNGSADVRKDLDAYFDDETLPNDQRFLDNYETREAADKKKRGKGKKGKNVAGVLLALAESDEIVFIEKKKKNKRENNSKSTITQETMLTLEEELFPFTERRCRRTLGNGNTAHVDEDLLTVLLLCEEKKKLIRTKPITPAFPSWPAVAAGEDSGMSTMQNEVREGQEEDEEEDRALTQWNTLLKSDIIY